jgi:PAS domain S-box-containing protein
LRRRKQDRQSRSPEIIILAVSIVIVLAIGGLSYRNARSAESATAERKLARDVVNLNNDLLSALKDAETGQRGFLVTGQAQFLQPYNQALPLIPGILMQLELLTRPTPDEHQRLMAIEPLVEAKRHEMQETIDLRRSNKNEQALALVNTGLGKAVMDDIRARCAALNRIAEQRLARSTALVEISSYRLRIVGTLGSALLLAFLLVSAATISRGLDRRDELMNRAYESEKKLAVTLASIADGVISTDAAARMTFLNPVAEQLTGWRQHECIGRHISEVFHIVNEATLAAVPNPLERAMAEGRAVGLANHTKLIARNGREIFIDDSAAPIRNENGELIGAVLVFRDISERRQSERELAQSVLTLQRSNEELQHFAFAASHDLRSPLRSVQSVAQLLARQFGDKLGKNGLEMIGYITDGASRMTRLVDDLLALARATHIDPEPSAAVSMQDAFDAACRSLGAEVRATKASITCAPLPVVAARDTHVTLVLQNILDNSLKYRGPEPPVIHVAAVRKDSEWITSIKDNGIGIDAQYSEKIFEPFKRLHGNEYDGTGIGLWTCKKIVSGYGGRIWVESEPGKGSTFFFSLPASQAPAKSAAA